MIVQSAPNQKEGLQFRLIVDEPNEGQWNMAVDEALLESVSAGDSPPVIRLYGFEPATLSVGRFQATAGTVEFERLEADGVGFVRRPTGGQSVLHADELTYAFVIGGEHVEPFGKRWAYRFVAPLLVAGLTDLGLRGLESSTTQKGNPTNPDCFGSTGQYEIDSRLGRKLVGSAQMITRTAVLQHGSIPLGSAGRKIVRYLHLPDSTRNHSSNLQEELGHVVDPAAVRESFARSFSERLCVMTDRLRPAEAERARELVKRKYSTEAWNRKY